MGNGAKGVESAGLGALDLGIDHRRAEKCDSACGREGEDEDRVEDDADESVDWPEKTVRTAYDGGGAAAERAPQNRCPSAQCGDVDRCHAVWSQCTELCQAYTAIASTD